MSSKKVLPKGRRYTDQQKEQAVRLVLLARGEGRGYAAVQRISDQLGYGVESVRQWVKQADIDAGAKAGLSTSERERMREMEAEIRELRRVNGILEAAASFFGAARPPIEALIEFIDREKERFGVEPICRALSAHECKIAPSTYYARKTRPPSARTQQDTVWVPILLALWTVNYRVYGAHKLWKAALRDGHQIGRDQVARLMRSMQIRGATRVRRVRTTIRDDSNPRSPDLVKRDFTAERPNRLWLTDITYVPTWSGVAYVCFIIDAYSRMIVGWRVAAHMRTDMVLDALSMASWSRGTRLEGLITHSDAGSQFTSLRYGERLAELGAVPSIGTVGDSYDSTPSLRP